MIRVVGLVSGIAPGGKVGGVEVVGVARVIGVVVVVKMVVVVGLINAANFTAKRREVAGEAKR